MGSGKNWIMQGFVLTDCIKSDILAEDKYNKGLYWFRRAHCRWRSCSWSDTT